MNTNGATNLVGATSCINFTWLTTFGRRHHSFPYSIFCNFPQELHPNGTFSQDSQMGVPKLGLLLFWNFGCSYFSQNKLVWNKQRQYLITLKNIFSTMYYKLQSKIIWPLIQGIYGWESNSQFDSKYFFNHDSCISSLNEQCEGTVSIYT